MTVQLIHKVGDGYRPNVIDLMKQGEIALVFNTPEDGRARKDSAAIRRTAVSQQIPYYLTVDGIQAAIGAIEALLKGELDVMSLQEYHAAADRGRPPRRRPHPRGPRRARPRTGRGPARTAGRRRHRLQDRHPALHGRRAGRRRAGPQAGIPGLPRPQIPRHPQHRARRRAGSHPAGCLHAERPRRGRRRDDAGRGRGRDPGGRRIRRAAAASAWASRCSPASIAARSRSSWA